MYSPQLGRWLNPDPLTRDPTILNDNNWYGDQMTSMRNVYGYCGNNPVNHADPTGLDWTDQLLERVWKLAVEPCQTS